jgi:2Fe-2S ferredoxin
VPTITYRHPDGRHDTVDVVPGTSVMRAAVVNGVDGIVGECGGQLICATCHVYVDGAHLDRLPELGDEEDEMLDETEAPRDEERSRLGCQLKMGRGLDEIVVDVPKAQ